jgi:hypothetical protein
MSPEESTKCVYYDYNYFVLLAMQANIFLSPTNGYLEWYATVLSIIKKSPFSHLKTIEFSFINLTS